MSCSVRCAHCRICFCNKGEECWFSHGGPASKHPPPPEHTEATSCSTSSSEDESEDYHDISSLVWMRAQQPVPVRLAGMVQASPGMAQTVR